MAQEIEELRKRIDELTKQAETLERRITLLPTTHPLRTQTETSLKAVRAELQKTKETLAKAEVAAMPQEIKALRADLAALTKDLSTRFLEIEATLLAAPVGLPEKAKRIAKEMDALRERITVTTYALGYGIPMGMAWKRLYEERLWAERMARGEVEVRESFASARNRFEVWHHIPSCETTVKVEPL